MWNSGVTLPGNFCLCLEKFLYFKVKSTVCAWRDRWNRCSKFLIAWKSAFFLPLLWTTIIGHNVPRISLNCFLCLSFPYFFISLKSLHDMCHMANTTILSLMFSWFCFVNCTFTERKKKCQQFGKENYWNFNEKRFENHQKTLWKPQSNVLLCTKDLLNTE